MQCSISECKLKATDTVKISFRETRSLCKKHYQLFINKDKKHLPNFTKASKFEVKFVRFISILKLLKDLTSTIFKLSHGCEEEGIY